MKFLIPLLLLCAASTSASAALVQWDAFNDGDELAVKDLETGTIWLDLSQSADVGYFQAGDLYDNWDYATNSQVEDLLAKSFRSFVPSTNTNYQNNCYVGNSCFDETQQWLDLFGATTHRDNALVNYGFGLYADETGAVRLGGGRINGSLGNAYIYGDEFSPDYSSYVTGAPTYYYSTFLTMSAQPTINAQLSEASMLGIFLTALGFVMLRRRKALTPA
ncbi:hypothetical protein [Aliiglaciecola litoralis]|uniref:PEP-CTERM protein-sorting domain-containing protein n=1 Tax=Aliiglaciecola litoralis TaxID=582857 RepID=A0ABN1LTW8_9ALTE